MRFDFAPEGSVEAVRKQIESLKSESALQTIAMFDLTDSTRSKSVYGHETGVKQSLKAVFLSKSVIDSYGGQTVKELGDGILCRFDDPLSACLAALAIKVSSNKLGLKIKGGITLGMVDLIKLNDTTADIYGLPVDRCSRILSFSLPGQILVDGPFLDTVRSKLLDYKNIVMGDGKKRVLKGVGDTELFELSTSEFGLKKYVFTSFRIHEDGRLPIADKVYFMKDAQEQIIEMGAGLRTFSRFFSGHRPSEFRDHIEKLLTKGVNLTLLLCDPNSSEVKRYFNERGESEYLQDISQSIKFLKKEQERLLTLALPGEFSIYLYKSTPTAHILCVDPEDETSGRMLVSPYWYGLSRSECPVYEFSRLSNAQLFLKYCRGLKFLLENKCSILE